MLQPVLLAGGEGTRLWPFFRSLFPKQFLKITQHTLIQETLLRLANLDCE